MKRQHGMKVRAALACVLALGALSAAADDPGETIYLGARPSVSGDGRTFVFEWADNIWIASTEGGKARPLLTGSGIRCWPVISADGGRVVFLSDADGNWKIFEQDIERGTIRQVSFHSESTYPYAYSRDGERLLCTVSRDLADKSGSQRVAYLPVRARGAEEMLFDAEASEPSCSPDGTSILFRRRGEHLYRKRTKGARSGQIWRYDLPTKRYTLLVKRDTDSRTPLWRPDGKGFYYVSGQDGTMNVWERDLETGKERQVTFFKGDNVLHPSLSADGRTMVFRQGFHFHRVDPTAQRPDPKRIDLVPVAYAPRPGARRRLYSSCWNNDREGGLDFCDKGMQFAFTTGGDLFVSDTLVREPRLVHGSSLTHERDCVFSNDGSALYYVSDRGDGSDLWVATCVSTNVQWWESREFVKRRLAGGDEIRRDLKISPDGTRLSWVTIPGGLTIADTNGVPLYTAKSPYCGDYVWSGDSRWLAVSMEDDDSNSDVWIVSADGKTPPYNVSRHNRWDGMPAWSHDGKVLAFVGERDDMKSREMFYLWLDPRDEADADIPRRLRSARAKVSGKKSDETVGGRVKPVKIDFHDLYKRVRSTGRRGECPFFSPIGKTDSRYLCYRAQGATYRLNLLERDAKASQMTSKQGVVRRWYEKEDRLCWSVDSKPAHFNTILEFTARQDTDIADYQELAFRTAWGIIRDRFYDPDYHGVDWGKVREKYLPYARHAASPSVFERVLQMMVGELNASHLGFSRESWNKKEWEKSVSFQSWDYKTAHLGLVYDPEFTGKGWRVKEVVREGAADRAAVGIRPGDVVETLDGRAVSPQMDPTEVLNAPRGKVFAVGVRTGTNAVREVRIKSESFAEVRRKVVNEACEAKRRRVYEASGGRFGYLDIAKMDNASYVQFEKDMFAEGYGKDGLVIDVRDNPGGRIADALLNILCRPEHGITMRRGGSRPGYPAWLMRSPVWRNPVVVLCNEESGSNSEIFSHAIKVLKRGRLVGQPTGGAVIWTRPVKLLDVGEFRMPFSGAFLLDGTDTEGHGAVPDVLVNEDLNAAAKGVDVQLEAAIRVLDEDVRKFKSARKPVKLKYMR